MQAFSLSAQFARESAMLKLPEERRKWDNNITISPTQNTPALQATSNLMMLKYNVKVGVFYRAKAIQGGGL